MEYDYFAAKTHRSKYKKYKKNMVNFLTNFSRFDNNLINDIHNKNLVGPIDVRIDINISPNGVKQLLTAEKQTIYNAIKTTCNYKKRSKKYKARKCYLKLKRRYKKMKKESRVFKKMAYLKDFIKDINDKSDSEIVLKWKRNIAILNLAYVFSHIFYVAIIVLLQQLSATVKGSCPFFA